MTAKLDAATMPGQVWGLAAVDPAGPIYLTSYAGRSPSTRNLNTTMLIAVDLAGTVVWQRTFPGHPQPPRVDADGTVWVAHHDGASTPNFTLTAVGANGEVLRSVTLQQEPPEHLGAVVRLPDGFCALWLPTSPRRRVGNGVARLARYGGCGDTIWSTPLPLVHGLLLRVVEAGVETGWQVRPKRAWAPSTLEVHHWQPLLVSGDRILAGINDGGSGIGVCAIVDTSTGRIISTTKPRPYGYKAIAGPERFLVGTQGYGAFSSTLYDRDGQPAQTWPSHGMMLVDSQGAARGPESENILPSRSRFRVLRPDGSMRDGPPLTGYYTSYPALDATGTTVFWRDGALLAIDADLHQRELFTMADDRAVISRILLLGQEALAVALGHELLLFHDTGLAPLASGPWPCADGTTRGNPAISA
jgi:outer membrane protein assembly factor BamB